MTLIGLLVVIAVVGLIVWLLTTFIPMDAKLKQLLVVVAIVGLLLVILKAFGVLNIPALRLN